MHPRPIPRGRTPRAVLPLSVARCRVSGQGIQPPTPYTGTRPPFHPAGVVPRFPVPVLVRVFRNRPPRPRCRGCSCTGEPFPRCPLPIRETRPGKHNGCSRCRVTRPGFLPRPGRLRSVSYAPCPRPPVVSVPGLGGAPPGRFPGTLPGCKPGGAPVLSNCTGRKEPGKPGTRPPGGYSPVGGGCLSAGREGNPPRVLVSGSPVAGGICAQFRAFLPTYFRTCFRFPRNPFRNGSRVTCSRPVLVAFLLNFQCSPGYLLRCGLSGYPAPVYPGGGSGLSGTGNPAPREPVSPGYRGLPPGTNRIHPVFSGVAPAYYPIIR